MSGGIPLRNAVAIGPRLYLRPSDPEDAAVFAPYTATEPEPAWDRIRIPSSEVSWKKMLSAGWAPAVPHDLFYSVCSRVDDRVVGQVALHNIDWVHRNAMTSAWIGDSALRNHGYGTEAKFLLLDIAFEQLGLHVLSSWVWSPNERSSAAVLKQGYRLAGRDPFDTIRGGVLRDAHFFDVLRDDYRLARAAWEQQTRPHLTSPEAPDA